MNESTNPQTTLITGSSSGIGLHLATEFAKHGHPLVLVAPDRNELETVAMDLGSTYSVDVTAIAADLREEAAAQSVFDQLGGSQIEILVNNAGHGKKGNAWEIPLEDDISMVALNIVAILRLTKLFLPPMVTRRSGRILNTASVAGFEPGPGYAVYSSTKAFVLSYSEGLATELKDSGVTVTALCPGPTDTDFFPKAGMLETRAFQQAGLMAPQDVAEAGYKALMAGDRVIVPGFSNKAMVFLRRLIPESLQAKLNELLTDDVPPDQQKRDRGVREAKE
ncbi:MAG: SDR family oxidoreductase [Verrucomicrobia bacterium]|nr:SDR family oxidoreductase [Verrucomicrobiota bacterium]